MKEIKIHECEVNSYYLVEASTYTDSGWEIAQFDHNGQLISQETGDILNEILETIYELP